MACEAVYLGREPVSGPTDAKTISSLIQKLIRENAPAKDDRRYVLHCGDVGLKLECSSRRDEGFESDDSESLRSTSIGSSDEKFCNIDLVSDVETSSANSSGSDFEEIVEAKQSSVVANSTNKLRDNYSLEDIVFCHTDGRVVVWIVRERNDLQAVVFQCKNEETAKKLFQTYNETNRRYKLDRTRKGRWGGGGGLTGNSQQPKSLPIILDKNNHDVNKYSKFQLLQRQPPHKWNLVERVDNEGMMHLEVFGGSSSGISDDLESGGGDSIVSLNTPDIKKGTDSVSSSGSVRQRQPSSIISEHSSKPERPARKNKPAPQPPQQKSTADEKKVILVPLKSGGPTRKPYPKEPHVVRGQVVRVLVSNPPSASTYSPPSQMSWWCLELAESRRNGLGTVAFWPPEIYTTKNHEIYRRRNRSKSPIHRPTRNKAITMQTPNNNNNGLSQKLKCFGEAVISKWSTNGGGSEQNMPPVLVRMTADSPAPKSVIKKSPKRDSNSDKKVTFSAFATVQMMD